MTKAAVEARDAEIWEIVYAQRPTGVRFIYYVATSRNLVPKTEGGYRTVQQTILRLRRSGDIPWDWIIDSSRWMRKPTTWDSVDEMLNDQSASYRRALWTDADTVVEVWCESESVAGVLLPVTHEWDVPLYPCHGQASDSFAWAAAQQYKDDPRDVYIYYYGNHDPHGYEISTQLEAKLVDFSGRDDIRVSAGHVHRGRRRGLQSVRRRRPAEEEPLRRRPHRPAGAIARSGRADRSDRPARPARGARVLHHRPYRRRAATPTTSPGEVRAGTTRALRLAGPRRGGVRCENSTGLVPASPMYGL